MTNPAAISPEELIRKINAANASTEIQEIEDKVSRDTRGRIVQSIDGSDANLRVSFTTRKVLHKTKTYENNGVPVFVEMEFITISSLIDKSVVIDTPVTAYYQWRFGKEYTAWKEGEALSTGTPLSVIAISDSDKLAINQIGIYSVEQLVRISDIVGLLDAQTKEAFKGVMHPLQSAAERYLATRNERSTANAQQLIEKLSKELERATAVIEKQNEDKQGVKKKSSEA